MNKWIKIFIIFIILLKLFSVTFIRLVPGADQPCQIQAGLRLSEGKGLTSSMDDLTIMKLKTQKDLSKSIYNYLTNWAPLESLIIAFINLLGLYSPISFGLLQFLFFAIGIIGWYLCIKLIFNNKYAQLIFLTILFILFFLGQGTSLFTWAIAAYVVLIFLKIQNGEEKISYYFIIALLSIISIYFRYQSLGFALSTPLLLLILSKSKSKFWKSVILGIIIVASYLFLNWFNRKMGIDLFSNLMAKPKGTDFMSLPKYLFFLIPVSLTGFYLYKYAYYPPSFYIVAAIINVFFFMVLVIYKKQLKKQLMILVPIFGVNLLLLLQSSIMCGTFTVLMIGRYWWFLSPLLLAIVLKPLDNWLTTEKLSLSILKIIPLFMLILLIFSSLFFLNHLNKKSKRWYNIKQEMTTFLDDIVKKQHLSPSNVIVFTGMPDSKYGLSGMLLIDNKYATFRRLEILSDDEIFISGDEKILLMIEKNSNWKQYLNKNMSYDFLGAKYDREIYLININKLQKKNIKS